ncbi:putative hemolysin [Rubricella aquisinus]|uniref:L-ornithine N(alpha)-acyltransferase n=1 Tax=Rubricella aquisinus TaxID=2028108 RepID=A0A840WN11_9RHOB|nr:GNAT family N-acyltransferase [Rubricella aquisinus]MBB5516439.1 putative hemolysin [Rubricella aquisinus]
MTVAKTALTVRIARSEEEIRAAQRLRYIVFVEEMGAHASDADRADRLERDRFDPYFDHLILVDQARGAGDIMDQVVGVYRVMRGAVARDGIGFYGADEYDLSPLQSRTREVLELGRSCVHRDYRSGMAMHLLWSGLGQYVIDHDIEVLFGVASFHGADAAPLAQPLSYLHHMHLAPADLRVRAVAEHFTPMDILPLEEVDRREALMAIPPLIKAYLRLGGYVGEGAFIDHAFNTVDVCLLMDTGKMQSKYRDMYTRASRR